MLIPEAPIRHNVQSHWAAQHLRHEVKTRKLLRAVHLDYLNSPMRWQCVEPRNPIRHCQAQNYSGHIAATTARTSGF